MPEDSETMARDDLAFHRTVIKANGNETVTSVLEGRAAEPGEPGCGWLRPGTAICLAL